MTDKDARSRAQGGGRGPRVAADDVRCASCSTVVPASAAFDGLSGEKLCRACFVEKAGQSAHRLGREERKAIERGLREELSGVLPRRFLTNLLEDGFEKILQGADFDAEVNRAANVLEVATGIAVCKEALNVLEAFKKLIEGQEEEVREKLRTLQRAR